MLKKQCLDAEVLTVLVSSYTRVKDQILTHSHYSDLGKTITVFRHYLKSW